MVYPCIHPQNRVKQNIVKRLCFTRCGRVLYRLAKPHRETAMRQKLRSPNRRPVAPVIWWVVWLAGSFSVHATTDSASETAPDTPDNRYATYASTLATVSALPHAQQSVQAGWTVVKVPSSARVSTWSFTPVRHPTHPSAVRRRLTFTANGALIDMNLLCEASTNQCHLLSGQLRAIQNRLNTRAILRQ